MRLPKRRGAPSERWDAQEKKTIVNVKKAEIEDLALRFRNEMKAEILKHCGSKAVGVVGSFVVNIEAHRALYAKNSTRFAWELTRRPFFLRMKSGGKSMPWPQKKSSACATPAGSNLNQEQQVIRSRWKFTRSA